MMRRFQRHNYDKILLAFLSDVYYWQSINHPIIETLKNNLNMFDEYVIKNFHSLLRKYTTAKVSSSKSLRHDALFIDNFRNENLFATSISFVLKRDYSYKKKI